MPMVKKLVAVGNSKAVVLPREWLDFEERRGPFETVLMNIEGDTITIKADRSESPTISDLKHYETRSWSTKYRGPLYIHAAMGFPKSARDFAETERALGRGVGWLPFGAIIGKLQLVDVFHTETVGPKVSGLERLYGDYSDGRYAWELAQPVLLPEPIPYRGRLGLFDLDEGTVK